MKKPKKKIKKIKFDKYIIFLAIISLCFLASVFRYMLRTFQFPEWDEQYYMQMATSYYRLLQHPTIMTPYEMLQIQPVKQPGYPLMILPFLLLFGLSNAYFWAIVTNGLLYIANIFGVYILAKHFVSKLAACLAAIIFAFYGWTLFHVHLAYTETATSALCVWAIIILVKSNYFQNRKYSILFGLFFGLSLFTRWAAIVFIAGPLLYVFTQIIKERLLVKKAVILNGVLALIATIIIPFFPYFMNWYWVAAYFNGHRVGGPMWQIIPQQEKDPFSLNSLTFYINSFEQLGIVYFLLIVVGIVLALRKKSNIKLILFAVIVPWIFFSFFSILKADRFIVPIYSFLAILSGYVFEFINNKFYKILLIVLVLILSIGTFFGAVWNRGPMKANLYSINLPFSKSVKIYLTTISHPPNLYKKSGKEIVDFIVKDSREAGIENPSVVSLFYYRPLDEPFMAYNLYHQKRPLLVNNYVGTIINDPDDEAGILIKNLTKDADYLLIKTGQTTDSYFSKQNYFTLKALIAVFTNNAHLENYYEEKTKIWIYQDSSIVTIYKKKKEIAGEDLENMRLKLIEELKQNNEKS